MRIRKLAKDLDCSSEQLLSLLHRLGHARYRDVEQQLADPVVQLVRRHAGELKQERAWRPPESTPMRRFDGPSAPARDLAPSPDDASALGLHLAGVRPLTPPPRAEVRPTARRAAVPVGGGAAAVAGPARVGALVEVPAVPSGAAGPSGGGPSGGVGPSGAARLSGPAARSGAGGNLSVAARSGHVSLVGLPAQSTWTLASAPPPPEAGPLVGAPGLVAAMPAVRVAEQDLAELRGQISAIAAERGELAQERVELRHERERIRAELELVLAGRDALARRAEVAEAEIVRLRAGASALLARPVHEGVPVRQLLEARGLRGEDEMGRALIALVEGRRTRDLLDALVLADSAPLVELLDERLLLVQGDEEVPSGLVGTPVGADRSESPATATVRVAVARLATAFLVHGLRRLVVIGGPGALHRVLHDALDPRIELRQLPVPSGQGTMDIAPGSVIVLWGGAATDRRLAERLPEGVRVRARDLTGFCAAVVERVERG